MPIDAAIVQNSPKAVQEAQRLMQETNFQTVILTDFTQDANVNRPPDYILHVFNIAQKSFAISRPPCFPTIRFAACPKGQPWVEVGRFPNIVNEKWIDADSGQVRNNGIHAERFLTDVINPANLGVNIWQQISDENMTWVDGGTNDYSRRGLFWTRNAKPGRTCMVHGGCGNATECPACGSPTADELQLAKSRMEDHYRALIAQADQYQREGTLKEIGPEHRLAAEYYKVRSQWYVVAELPSECPNCGEAMKEGAHFHVNSVAKICVRPAQESWRVAVRAGVKHKSEVPDEFRWWGAKAAAATAEVQDE